MGSKKNKLALISPFSLVLFLTLFCLIFATLIQSEKEESISQGLLQSLVFWQEGFFGLLDFTLQMMMILVFGYALAIYKPIHSFLRKVSFLPNSPLQAVMMCAGITILAGLLNWGFGLVIGALLARFVFLAMKEKRIESNPILLASAGYLGMAVWHGGLSGSAPLKVAEVGHFMQGQIGVIPVSETIFSSFNLGITGGLIVVYFLTLWFLSFKKVNYEQPVYSHPLRPVDHHGENYLGLVLGGIMILLVGWKVISQPELNLGFLNLNLVNYLLFGACLMAYRGLSQFTEAITEGLKSSVDIFIQFPFYAGILGMVTQSGLLELTVGYFIDNSDSSTFPLFGFISSALINLLVPSGGGQWAVQGPLLMEISQSLGLSPARMVMVFSYGDQISNLLQPFWALPLLSITGVKAKDLLKIGLWLFLAGFTYLAVFIYYSF
ncbi:TIGR00366 family protein [Algoriphagus hitonicola]|uniref:TIGR00366 family protein n=1 Tax=Algoriphagus hitonicola TaxID=435880 RepID=UPI001161315E|nr:TIGR00366 family protein [Algoriphagus hitonicola]